jgi:hypothetical protein
VKPAFAQPGVRYFAASPDGATEVVLGHAGERLNLFREDGTHLAEGRRAAAAAAINPLGIEWATAGSGVPSSPSTTAPATAPPPGNNPLGVEWAGGGATRPAGQPQPPPQPQPMPSSSNPLGIDWLGNSTTSSPSPPPAPSQPGTPAPTTGGGLNVGWQGGSAGPQIPTPTTPPSGGGLGVEWQTGDKTSTSPTKEPLPPTHLPGVCRDPWITETITRLVGRAPQGHGDTGECDFRRYGGGTWGSKAELEAHVRAAFNVTPPAPTAAYVSYASHADPDMCMDVPGGSPTEGTQLQLRGCNGSEAQRFELQADGHLVAIGGKPDPRGHRMCVDYYPSAGNNGDAVRIWPCHPIPNPSDTQYWTRLASGEFRSASGRCIDIQGGRGNAGRDGNPLVLWDCPDPQNYNTRRWSEPAAAREAARNTPPPLPPKRPSGICADPWVTEKVRLVTGRAPEGEGSTGECDISRYGGGQWNSKAELERHVQRAFGRPVGPVRGLYVIDGTDSKFQHQNAMWHLFKRWEDYAIWSDGVNLAASNVDALYSRMYNRICQDLKPVGQGGKGVQEVFIAGYSRGAIMSVRLSREVMRNCGANVRFVGLVDAVNTLIYNWPVDLDTRIPVRVHIRKKSSWEHVLTTRDIDNAERLVHPRDVDHKQIVCQDGALDAWRWTVEQLVDRARLAGGPVGPPRSEGTAC